MAESYEKEVITCDALLSLKWFIWRATSLTSEEENILKKISHLPENIDYSKSFKKINKLLALQGLKRCRRCGKVLEITEYYKHMAICKHCYNSKRKRR